MASNSKVLDYVLVFCGLVSGAYSLIPGILTKQFVEIHFVDPQENILFFLRGIAIVNLGISYIGFRAPSFPDANSKRTILQGLSLTFLAWVPHIFLNRLIFKENMFLLSMGICVVLYILCVYFGCIYKVPASPSTGVTTRSKRK